MLTIKQARLLKSIVLHLVLLCVLVVGIYPLLWMFSTAFKPEDSVSLVSIMPTNPTLANIRKVLVDYPFWTFFSNSLMVSLGSTVVAIILGTLGGYALARMRAPGLDVIFMVLLFTLMVPVHVRLIPIFMIMHKMGLGNTLLALTIPHIASPISIFLSRQFFKTIPRDLDEAAIIDGCSWFMIFWRIIMPLSKPMISALFIVKFMGAWNDFIWPLMVTNTVSKYPLTVGLSLLRQQHSMNWGLNMAGASLASIPVIIVFLIFQRYFISGLAMSGMKN